VIGLNTINSNTVSINNKLLSGRQYKTVNDL